MDYTNMSLKRANQTTPIGGLDGCNAEPKGATQIEGAMIGLESRVADIQEQVAALEKRLAGQAGEPKEIAPLSNLSSSLGSSLISLSDILNRIEL